MNIYSVRPSSSSGTVRRQHPGWSGQSHPPGLESTTFEAGADETALVEAEIDPPGQSTALLRHGPIDPGNCVTLSDGSSILGDNPDSRIGADEELVTSRSARMLQPSPPMALNG